MSGESRAVRTDRAGRGLVIGIALVLAGVLCLGRLVQWQLIDRDRLLDVAGSRLSLSQSAEPLRGTIMDRTGSVVLAATVMRYQLIAETSALTDAERTAIESTLLKVLALGSRRVVPGASSAQPLMSRLPKRCVPRRPRGSSLGSHCAKCERDSIRNLAAPLRQASRVTSLDSSMPLELANTE